MQAQFWLYSEVKASLNYMRFGTNEQINNVKIHLGVEGIVSSQVLSLISQNTNNKHKQSTKSKFLKVVQNVSFLSAHQKMVDVGDWKDGSVVKITCSCPDNPASVPAPT